MSDSLYCSKCGAELRNDMSFCPKCGQVVAGSVAEEMKMNEAREYARESAFMWIKFLLIIYAIPVIIVSIFNICSADLNATELYNANKTICDERGLTIEILKNAILTSGILGLISGIGAGVSLVCVARRKNWIIAFISCIISAILSVWMIIGLFIGLFVAWLIYDVKDSFVDQPQKSKG